MLVLLRKEIVTFLSTLMGYAVICVFLFITGFFIWVLPETEFNLLENGIAALDSLFILAPWIFLFLVPAITMRMFSEENRSGTIETLLTRPLTDLQIVIAKFGASVLLVVISLIPTIIYLISVLQIASPPGNVDIAGIAGSYLGLIFLCSGFTAIGIFASSLTNNQIVSFIFAVILCFFFYSGFDLISGLITGSTANVVSSFGISNHYASMSRGVIDTRDVFYFLSLIFLFIVFTKFNLEKRKW